MGRREHQTGRTPGGAAAHPVAGRTLIPGRKPVGDGTGVETVRRTPTGPARVGAAPVGSAPTGSDAVGPTAAKPATTGLVPAGPATTGLVPAGPVPTGPVPAGPGPDAAPAVGPGMPAPHRWRYARHLERLAAVARAGGEAAEAAAVAAVLEDPDPVMAESAVVTHLDRRAARLRPGAEFTDWARALGPVLAGREFAARRLREWTLLRAVEAGAPWSPAELAGASDWCQRTAVRTLAAPDALALLARSARTHRVRGAATGRLRRAAAA
ncbi:hypothetical protein [Streptomyces sp. NPDC048606]|uniref:hypothetical protein n=1 Tax=Streptomyces sp. NPDC048606 TaxID=3154726 RepID=UPI00342647C3